MQLSDHLYLVGSDQFGLSSPRDSNIYLIDGSSTLALIDVGRASSVDLLLGNCKRHGLDLEQVSVALLTHADPGHSEACALLRKRFGLDVRVSDNGVDLLTTGQSERFAALRQYGVYDDTYAFPTTQLGHVLVDGDCLPIGNVELSVIHVRGHGRDCVCFYGLIDGQRALFTGTVSSMQAR